MSLVEIFLIIFLHSPDLAPSDDYLLPNIKSLMISKYFENLEGVNHETIIASFLRECMEKLVLHCKKCTKLKNGYKVKK